MRFVGADLSAVAVNIGLLYTFRYTFTAIYLRGRDGVTPKTQGRTQLRRLELSFHDTTEFFLEVTPKGRAKYTYTLAKAAPRDGTFKAAVQARAEDTLLELVQNTAGGCRFSSADWEGFAHQRSRQR